MKQGLISVQEENALLKAENERLKSAPAQGDVQARVEAAEERARALEEKIRVLNDKNADLAD